jgi:hypothetical protein
MPRPRSDNELESLRSQEQALKERIKQVEARDRAKKARDDHRRWQLVGQAALARLEAEPQTEFASVMLGLINAHARSTADRALFNLPPLSKAANGSNAGSSALETNGL